MAKRITETQRLRKRIDALDRELVEAEWRVDYHKRQADAAREEIGALKHRAAVSEEAEKAARERLEAAQRTVGWLRRDFYRLQGWVEGALTAAFPAGPRLPWKPVGSVTERIGDISRTEERYR